MTALAPTAAIAALAVGFMLWRPWHLPEAVWAVAGAVLLVALGLLPPGDAWHGITRGTDVYLFLAGMMLLAEAARREGLFDWLAAAAALHARGSATRLFTLVFVVGTIVTAFLSNDATAVVLTPAVASVARAARAEKPLPYLLVCAFIANAASFVLPISNPANLVVYASAMPPLADWLRHFALPSLLAILATYVALRLTQAGALRQAIAAQVETPALTPGGRLAAAGIALTAVVLMAASARGWRLGLPTCLAGVATAAAILAQGRRAPWGMVRHISWGVLPLVAGLFVLVEGLDRSGATALLSAALRATAGWSEHDAALASGTLVALVANAVNNLPAGLIAAAAIHGAQVPPLVTRATLVGVDLGPNLSVTGSLATILWLAALRREGLHVGGGAFLRLGLVVMPPALILALAALLLGG